MESCVSGRGGGRGKQVTGEEGVDLGPSPSQEGLSWEPVEGSAEEG